MTSPCEVCASEPFKYRCPTCGLMSCSLACTRTHKIYCAPKAPSTDPSNEATDTQPQLEEANRYVAGEEGQMARNGHNSTPRELSSQIKDLIEGYSPLRDQLRDIYTATLQEQWVEGPVHDKPRHFGRGKPPQRNRGPWTREKGFNRGLGKVRKYRGRCEDGLETGKGAEGFMRLLALVNEGGRSQEPQ
ncbi:hypothetical protein BDW59DRAFT_110410 [Aspergillus cavernicola]|uniref:HIT-type domain-containing protein n=1 Tax=Aspergillus cavernicola TaxID=176166 RepID=A0ABR4I2Z5_9EURO